MWSLWKHPGPGDDARDGIAERLLRRRRAGLSDAQLSASIAGAWRRIEQRRFPARPPRRRQHPLLVPSLALLCFLCGLWIGVSLEFDDQYGAVMSDLASHPLIAELAP